MSSASSGMPWTSAWTSGRDPLRPATVAVPPAKLSRVGASCQPSPERVSTAAWLSTNGWRSMRPLPVSLIVSGVISARVEKAKAAPRRPAKAARTWPEPLTSLALAVSRASVIPLASIPRASTTPSMVVRSSARMMLPSARPLRTAKAPGKLAPLAVRCASMRWA